MKNSEFAQILAKKQESLQKPDFKKGLFKAHFINIAEIQAPMGATRPSHLRAKSIYQRQNPFSDSQERVWTSKTKRTNPKTGLNYQTQNSAKSHKKSKKNHGLELAQPLHKSDIPKLKALREIWPQIPASCSIQELKSWRRRILGGLHPDKHPKAEAEIWSRKFREGLELFKAFKSIN